jgi:hypothetical protein
MSFLVESPTSISDYIGLAQESINSRHPQQQYCINFKLQMFKTGDITKVCHVNFS